MKNTLSLIVNDDKRVVTEMTTSDGVTVVELHNKGENDEEVLVRMSKNKFHRSFQGEWELTLPQDAQKFEGKEFTDVTSKALAYINDRDNPNI